MRGPSVDEDVGVMVGSGPQTQLDESEYDVIESAMAATERGRRFLAEFARRHRGADTDTLLQAIGRLESVVTRDTATVSGSDDARADLTAMAESIAQTRSAIAAMGQPDGIEGHPAAAETLDTLVRGAERATTDILGAAEAIQEAAWGLREKGADSALCDVLDHRAIAIYTACSIQDLTTQRSGLAIATLRDLEARIAGLLGQEAPSAASIPSEPAPKALPPIPDALSPEDELDFAPSQASIDPPPAGPQPRPAASEAEDADDLALAFSDLDRLSIEEKIALFS